MRVLVMVVLVALVAGCEDDGPDTSTPESTFRALLRAQRAGDVDTLWSLITPAARAEMGRSQREALETLDDEVLAHFDLRRRDLETLSDKELLSRMTRSAKAQAMQQNDARIVEVERDGDQARLTWASDEVGPCEIGLVRTADGWRVDDPGDCAKTTVTTKTTLTMQGSRLSPSTAARLTATPPQRPIDPVNAAALRDPAFKAQPAPDQVALLILTTPPGARVWIDRKEVGVSPVRVERAPGPVTVEVELAGYRPQLQQIDPLPGYAWPVELQLVR